MNLKLNNTDFIDTNKPIDISIPLSNSEDNTSIAKDIPLPTPHSTISPSIFFINDMRW